VGDGSVDDQEDGAQKQAKPDAQGLVEPMGIDRLPLVAPVQAHHQHRRQDEGRRAQRFGV
jgi:hypothetical protein